ncbi:50S ribosomal protein L13 [Candidatus Saccharibacteria bacterium]|nr:MAG: 50S ribosomal protein L13 [Candidatus Saccharibacteria bacterium]
MNKTFSLKSNQVDRKWVIIDASEAPLGRVATLIATRLTGKYKPTFTPHMDDGDHVIVINAANLVVTGNKEKAKNYYNYSGFPSGMKVKTLADVREKDPAAAITAAVKGMLPKNKLAADRLSRLRVFVDENHTHAAQKPVKIGVK